MTEQTQTLEQAVAEVVAEWLAEAATWDFYEAGEHENLIEAVTAFGAQYPQTAIMFLPMFHAQEFMFGEDAPWGAMTADTIAASAAEYSLWDYNCDMEYQGYCNGLEWGADVEAWHAQKEAEWLAEMGPDYDPDDTFDWSDVAGPDGYIMDGLYLSDVT